MRKSVLIKLILHRCYFKIYSVITIAKILIIINKSIRISTDREIA